MSYAITRQELNMQPGEGATVKLLKSGMRDTSSCITIHVIIISVAIIITIIVLLLVVVVVVVVVIVVVVVVAAVVVVVVVAVVPDAARDFIDYDIA